jgi:hypothetical protein
MHSRSLAWDTADSRSQYRQTILPSPGDPDLVTVESNCKKRSQTRAKQVSRELLRKRGGATTRAAGMWHWPALFVYRFPTGKKRKRRKGEEREKRRKGGVEERTRERRFYRGLMPQTLILLRRVL